MKEFLKKLLSLFKQPDPKKPVHEEMFSNTVGKEWPFPEVSKDFNPRECCGKCEPAKKPVKPVVKKKPAAKKIAVKKATKQPAKKAK